MVHITDGFLSPEILMAGIILTGLLLAYTLKKTPIEKIPKLSIITAALFVASLIHIPIGPTSVHLILNGLAGVVLGMAAFPAVFVAVLLQFFLFQHGGITTIGINTLTMGIPALISYSIFKYGLRFSSFNKKEMIIGGLCGGLAIVFTIILTSITLYVTGDEFMGVLILLSVGHIPVIIVEAILVGSVVGFLMKVKPDMLEGSGSGKSESKIKGVKI